MRAAIPGVAVHADVIAGFPTEDDAAFERSLAFIRELDPAGLHVFRYSARPDTPATRMAGQVPDKAKKARAARLLELSAGAKTRFARRTLGTETRVLLESRLDDGRWVGHAEDHVPVAIAFSRSAGSPGLATVCFACARIESYAARKPRTCSGFSTFGPWSMKCATGMRCASAASVWTQALGAPLLPSLPINEQLSALRLAGS